MLGRVSIQVSPKAPAVAAVATPSAQPLTREDWRAQFEARGITVVTTVLRDGAIEVFTNYSQRVDKVVYNGRNSTERDNP
jgi:hypothetical protein